MLSIFRKYILNLLYVYDVHISRYKFRPKLKMHFGIKDHDFTTIMDLGLIFWPLFVTPLAFFGFDFTAFWWIISSTQKILIWHYEFSIHEIGPALQGYLIASLPLDLRFTFSVASHPQASSVTLAFTVTSLSQGSCFTHAFSVTLLHQALWFTLAFSVTSRSHLARTCSLLRAYKTYKKKCISILWNA